MKLVYGNLIALSFIISLPSAAEDMSNNPFIKPSHRVMAVKDSCDVSVINKLIEEKLSDGHISGIGHPAIIQEMTNKDRIIAMGAKLVTQVNGVDVYFDENKGVFLYDDTTNSENKG